MYYKQYKFLLIQNYENEIEEYFISSLVLICVGKIELENSEFQPVTIT